MAHPKIAKRIVFLHSVVGFWEQNRLPISKSRFLDMIRRLSIKYGQSNLNNSFPSKYSAQPRMYLYMK